jgi:hypothetical protein
VKKDKTLKDNPAQKVAVLIDGDNASSTKLQDVTELAGRYGNIIVRKIYGDWSKTSLSSWKESAREFAYRLIETLPDVKGKNTTDITLAIEAMDLLNREAISITLELTTLQ